MNLSYVAGRFATLLLVIWLAVTINFMLPRLTPGDPIEERMLVMAQTSGSTGFDIEMWEAYRARFGLDLPLWRQYLNYWESIFQLDLGYSLQHYPERVANRIITALPWTIGLLGTSVLIGFSLGTLLGSAMAWPRFPRWLTRFVPGFMVLSAIPYYLLGIMLVSIVAINWKLLPPAGGHSYTLIIGFNLATAQNLLRHATLPAMAIVLGAIGSWALGMRAMTISVLGEDYVTMAQAKGLRQSTVYFWYGLRTCMLPQMTSLALALGHIVSGAILVEVIFSYPGVGLKLFEAIRAKDYTMIQGIVLMLTVSISFALFLIDLTYPLIDPRIAYRRR